MYYGIPYAQPPVGPLRFQPPAPYTGNTPDDVISSDNIRPACIQAPLPGIDLSAMTQSEDCLHLNIFSPPDASDSPGTSRQKKVMVWIHGGGYIIGGVGVNVPTDLVAEYDVIVVSFHYRLGFLGFVSTGDAAAPGNNGLRDQVMALTWVKDNIRAFGGDPDDVTIFGESAGSGSVSVLSLSPYSAGLFTKAIMQSGTALTPWSSLQPRLARQSLYRMAGRLRCLPWWSLDNSVTYHSNILACLRNKPAADIESFQDMRPVNGHPFSDLMSGVKVAPAVDGDFLPRDPKLLLSDSDYLQQNGISSRAYIVGNTNAEGYSPTLTLFQTQDGMRALAEGAAKVYYPSTTNDEMVDLIDFTYSYPRQADGSPAVDDMADVVTDLSFVYPSVNFINILTTTSPSTDVFFFIFDHYPDLVNKTLQRIRTPHAWDLVYLFDQEVTLKDEGIYQPTPDVTTADSRTMTDVFRGVLSQFAKTGNPSRGVTGESPTSWPRYDPVSQQYMSLSPTPEVKNKVYSKRMSLWNDFLPQVATNLFAGRKGWF